MAANNPTERRSSTSGDSRVKQRAPMFIGFTAVVAAIIGVLLVAPTVASDVTFADAPNAATTGAPADVTLTDSGSITVKVPGTVIDAMNVSGTISILADDVTIRNSRISANNSWYGVRVGSGISGLTIVDTEIFGARSAAVSYGAYEAIRVNVHSSRDGLLAGSNTIIRDSWIHDLQSRGVGIKTVGGSDTILSGNHVDLPANSSGTGIQLRADRRDLQNWLIQDNFLSGGRYALYFDTRRHSAENIQFKSNLFKADSWSSSAASLKASPSLWSGNRTTEGEEVTTSRDVDDTFSPIDIPWNDGPARSVGTPIDEADVATPQPAPTTSETTTSALPTTSTTQAISTTASPDASAPDEPGVGSYLRFDGNNDYVSLGALDLQGSQLTIEALVNAEGFANCRLNDCRIVSKANGVSSNQHLWMLSTITQDGEERLRFRLNTGGSTKTLIASKGPIETSTWYHVAATYDGSRMRLYLNGEEVGSTSMSGAIAQDPSIDAWIGGNPNGSDSRPWQGGIDEIRIWSVARTQAQLAASMQTLVGSAANLVAYYPIDSSQQVSDVAGNKDGRLGTSTGADASDPVIVDGQVPLSVQSNDGSATATTAPTTTQPPLSSTTTQPPLSSTTTQAPPSTSPPSSNGTASSVSQDGITWTFDKSYPVGQYINGDWWVLGPVTVVHISPEWDGARHGSQVNPMPGNSSIGRPQGYHTGAPDYRDSVNAAIAMPLQLNANDSLISTIGWSRSDPGAPLHSTGLRPDVRSASVLTVVGTQPPSDAFRPQYSGGSKDVHRWSEVNMSLLPSLPRTGINTPSLASVNQEISGVFVDHLSYWNGREIHPSENTADYGRDIAVEMHEASLVLMLDYSAAEKRQVAINLIQRGIDLHGLLREAPSVAQNGRANGWWGDFGGGHGVGRKWPILFSGIMLDDPQMKNIGQAYGAEFFQEDCQIRYGNSGAEMVTWTGGGMEWGEFLCTRPNSTPSGNSAGYRTCCTGNAINGAALSVYLMDRHNANTNAQELWNNPVFFDYIDHYMDELSFSNDWQRSFSGFMADMWDTHR